VHSATRIRADVVLVGGGHTHVQILRRWIMRPVDGVRLTVVLDRPEAVYSGMVPGFVAGDYATHELEIDVVPLARRAGARVVLAPAIGIDPGARRIEVEGRAPIAWDLASLDVGSTVRGCDLPGVREHALATRPIRTLVDRVAARVEEAARSAAGTVRVVVVGAGAAGVELACTLGARIRRLGARAEITVVSDAAELLVGYPRRVAARMRRELDRRGIAVRERARAAAVERDGLVLETGRVPADLVVWATGAGPLPFLARAPLPLDADGFVRIRATLQVDGHDDLFAAGDCASLAAAPWVRKAGVYAVRQGPVLDANLRARLDGTRLRRYRAQRDFLSLLNLGGRRALAAKWGIVAVGGWVWRWKDHIDRRFVERFQVLAPDGAPAPAFDVPAMSEEEEMACGGCAAKIDAPGLAAALDRLPPAPPDPSVLVGLAAPDDAAAVRLSRGDVLLATVDGFRAFTDDPWLVGAVAAANAVSDVFAKGGRPRHALALVTIPEAQHRRAEETLYQVLAGARRALDPLGVTLVGGHSASGPELFASLTITGELAGEDALLRLAGAQAGDALVFTKQLGTGVVLAADMRGRCRGEWLAQALTTMLRANERAARVARDSGAHACTDVSGFGLAGHLAGMLRASGVSARLVLDALPALPGAMELFALGLRSSAHASNARVRQLVVVAPARADDPRMELLYDPQTSGGLLLALPAARAADAVRALRDGGDLAAAVVGGIAPARSDGLLIEVS
jgi:selenide,water dikinase